MIKYGVFLLLAALLGYFLFAAGRHAGKSEQAERVRQAEESGVIPAGFYQTITAEEAKRLLDEDGALTLLDVRTEAEFREGHIAGAVLIPGHELAARAADALPDRDATILVYCRSGNRSAAAAKLLADMGYTDIRDFGGILSWPYETVP